MAKASKRQPPPVGRFISATEWRNPQSGESDGSVVICVDVSYAAARLRIDGSDLGQLIDALKSIEAHRMTYASADVRAVQFPGG